MVLKASFLGGFKCIERVGLALGSGIRRLRRAGRRTGKPESRRGEGEEWQSVTVSGVVV